MTDYLLDVIGDLRTQVERLHFDLDREAHARQAAEQERDAWRSAASAYRRTSEGYARLHWAAESRAEDYEGRYETAHASRMHAEDCYHAELARAESAESALAAVRALAEDLLDSMRCGLHCDPDGKRSPYCWACEDSGEDHDCPPREVCEHTVPYRKALDLRAALATPTTTEETPTRAEALVEGIERLIEQCEGRPQVTHRLPAALRLLLNTYRRPPTKEGR